MKRKIDMVLKLIEPFRSTPFFKGIKNHERQTVAILLQVMQSPIFLSELLRIVAEGMKAK